MKFIENLGFTSTNDRLFIGILKDLGFLNRDGGPQPRYFEFLDKSRSRQVLASGIKEAFADLFAINVRANDLSVEDVRNKLRTLYVGKKTDLVIGNIAKTFKALCDYADFSNSPLTVGQSAQSSSRPEKADSVDEASHQMLTNKPAEPPTGRTASHGGHISVAGLQYHINIVLPDTKDQGVYDAIFKSLRDHLG